MLEGILVLVVLIVLMVFLIKKDNAQRKARKEAEELAEKEKRNCVSCGKALRYYKNNTLIDEWILVKTENKNVEEVNSIGHIMGGYSTVNTNKKMVMVRHYKCPKCGYERTEEC